MKSLSFSARLVFCCTLTIFLAILIFSVPSHAQSPQDEYNRATVLFNDGQKRYNVSDFRGAIEQWENALTIFKKLDQKQAIGAASGNLGIAYYSLGDYRKAISYHEQALAIAEEIGDKQGKGNSLGNLGLAYTTLGDYRKAISYYEQALAIAEEIGDKKGKGIWLGNLGLAYTTLGDYRKAIGYHEQALAIAEEIGDKQNKGNQLGNLGLAYRNLGDYRKAISYYEQALAIAEEIGDKKGKGIWLGNLGLAYRNLGDYRKAISYHEQALAIAEEIGDKKGKGAGLGNLGNAYRNFGDYRKAISYYEQALAIAEEIGNKQGKGNSLGNLGNAYRNFGDYRKAIGYYEQALAIAEEIGNKQGKGNSLGNLGNAYHSLGDYRKAISYYEQALAIAEEIGDKQGKGADLGNLGLAYSNLGDYRKAISFYEQALAIAEEIGDKKGKGIRLGNLGNAYDSLGEYRKAISYHEQAISINKEIGVPYSIPEGNLADAYLALDRDEEAFTIYKKHNHPIRLGRYYLKKNDFQQAKEQFDRDREKYEEAKRAGVMLPQWIGLGLSHEGLKEYERAYSWYTKAIEFMEEQRAALTSAEREHYFEGHEFHFPRIEAYEGATRCAFLLGKLDDAFYWAENTRGRVLSELLSKRHSGTSHKIPTALVLEEEELTTQITINKKQQQTAFEKNNPELLKQSESEYPALKRQMDKLIDRLRKDYPQYAAIKYPQPVKLSQLALKKGETIIEYEVTDPYTIGMVIRDGKIIKGFKVAKTRTELGSLIRKFRSPFQAGGDINESGLNQARELTDLLIGPALSELKKGEHLIIVPDESLSLLPFESLLLVAPLEVLKAEATLLAQVQKQAQNETTDRSVIIRGLTRTTNTRGIKISPRVSAHILFDTGSAKISKESKKQMEEFLAALKSKELKNAPILIEGHTDSIGDAGYNLKLSRRRAEAVYQYVVQGGIKQSSLSFTGQGDTAPVADNATEKGRAQNRRVDFVRIMEKQAGTASTAMTSVSRSLVYAIDEYPISYYQSASVLSLQRGLQASRVKGPSFFGLGDPVFDTKDSRAASMRGVTIVAKKDITGSEGTKDAGYHFSRLTNTAKEVKEVSNLFADSRTLIGKEASKSNLQKEDLTTRRYVLFSTHGILGNEIPYIKQPALVLNLVGNSEEDGFLTASEIFNMDLNADLVGLSACQTGLGIQSAGEGVVGLSRAFMYAGTDSVLVSLWSVADDSTYKLMVKFFEGLKQGKGKLTALKDAKNYLRQNGYDNPFYWAPFILVGEAD